MTHNRDSYDLHTHSHFSDGTISPAEIARQVRDLGLRGFALTDHDTIAGWGEAAAAAQSHGVEFIPGVELTTTLGGVSPHLLGYGFDPGIAGLADRLAEFRSDRQVRAREIVRLLSADYPITWELVQKNCADTEAIGRPHIADTLVTLGVCRDRTQAFQTLLHQNSKYYVRSLEFHTATAVRMICESGGVAVLAHPAAARTGRVISEAQLAELVAAGLWGIELRHPENKPELLPELYRLADSFGLQVTGASDFHGAGKTNRLGQETTPAATVAQLTARFRG